MLTQYCIKHSQVGEVKDFTITDADYVDFKKMLHKRKFTYDRQSEKMLKNLKEIAEFEGYMDGAKEEFAALETKLTHNLDHELDRFSKEIKRCYCSGDFETLLFPTWRDIATLER